MSKILWAYSPGDWEVQDQGANICQGPSFYIISRQKAEKGLYIHGGYARPELTLLEELTLPIMT
jgi:hypothetical protein